MGIKRLKINKAGSLPYLLDINNFEKINELLLPRDLKLFFLEQNPITVVEKHFYLKGKMYTINGFYPFDSKNSLSFEKAFSNLKSFYCSKYIGFADDPGGWEFIISLQKKDYGKIYFCRMDEELENALTLLAGSFEEFINGLKE